MSFHSSMRPELNRPIGGPQGYAPTNGTAYLMVYNAVKSKQALIRGRLHYAGESCAIGSFFDVNDRCWLYQDFIDEVAAVNDSFKGTGKQRRTFMLRWLRWKLVASGMPEFANAKKP